MKAHYNLLGKLVGYLLTPEEVQTLRQYVNSTKGSKKKFDALAILREED